MTLKRDIKTSTAIAIGPQLGIKALVYMSTTKAVFNGCLLELGRTETEDAARFSLRTISSRNKTQLNNIKPYYSPGIHHLSTMCVSKKAQISWLGTGGLMDIVYI